VPLGQKMKKVFFSVEATLSNLGSFLNLTGRSLRGKRPSPRGSCSVGSRSCWRCSR
jgi:hypothetical protein